MYILNIQNQANVKSLQDHNKIHKLKIVIIDDGKQ